ncbi:sirohydrochlorin chelatase [Imhoffiella purpurea]|uniref:Sirohydrochlorin cobaltochelatase n=1 Tax=Imhoffiella purpurea TaxID=1249627 RepID=W9VVM2_9GAMM|nr:sirohydrochlorin chelatase [Imhoffiella purpurea]EXJ14470.1 Sirohydrochlorin cobaltochelatase [Imhoffiella purpurea]
MTETTILLVGHGTRFHGGNAETERFAEQWRTQRPDWHIETCYIEWADRLLDAGLDQTAATARRVLVLPFILNAAGHVKMEIPAAVEAARRRHPGVSFAVLRHLGMGPEIKRVLAEQLDGLMADLAMPDPRTTGVILLGRGSSDAGANGELARMARFVFEETDHDLVDLAFTGITWPRLETAVQRQVRLGMTQIAILPVYLFAGRLTERIAVQVARLETQYPGIAFALAEHFGFDEKIFALLESRVLDADLPAASLLECDGCKYRTAAQAEHLHDHSHTHAPGAQHEHGHAPHVR